MNLKKILFKKFLFCSASFILNSCATYDVQKGKKVNSDYSTSEEPDLKVFLVGDAGNADEPAAQQTLNFVKSKLDSAGKKAVLIFTGDNIYPLGMPPEGHKDYEISKVKLENQLKLAENFEGKFFITPGNHDWYHGLEGLSAQEKFVNDYLKTKKAFLPRKGCPIDEVDLNEKTKMIVVDSEWYITDWNKHYGINKECDIKTREDFLTELDDRILKNQDKTILLLIHHPLMTNGVHGGFDSFKTHIFPFNGKIPLPIVGTLLTGLQKSSGVVPADLNNSYYAKLTDRIKNMIQKNKNIIVVSGHDHNLQYIEQGNIKQIISGAGSKVNPATVKNENDFSYGGNGYAVLNIYGGGKSDVEFYSTKDNHQQKIASIKVTDPEIFDENSISDDQFAENFTGSLYTERQVKRSGFYRFLFGKKYRTYYGKEITVSTANLSTLKGGLTPVREGGGFQSNSLRMVNGEGQMFTMRQMSKSATRFLTKVDGLNRSTFGSEFDDTYVQGLVQDFFTSNHPFTPFIVGKMADKIGVFHTNPELYYVPKQRALGKYNEAYGDRLYMIEEQISEDPKTLAYFENADKFEDTNDVIENLKEPKKYAVDEKAWIRARLFDMAIGDWDRHHDQWKWAAYKKDGKTLYRPVPKDRDQAFAKYEGILLKLIMTLPAMLHMKSYEEDIKNIKWASKSAYPLDLIFAKNTNQSDWKNEAEFIQNHLTPQDVEAAFAALPKEFQDENSKVIQHKLNTRISNLQNIAQRYHAALQERILVTGTDTRDFFSIEKLENAIKISAYDVKKSGEKELFFEKIYDDRETKEIWIYGLNGEDTYEITGNSSPKILVRMIGGYDNDVYSGQNGKKTKIYDFDEENNTLNLTGGSRRISDDYNLNMYSYRKPTHGYRTLLPFADYNPDDGVKILLNTGYVFNNFIREPYSQRHKLQLGIATATGAFSAKYTGIFKKALGDFDFGLNATYLSPNYVQNFFGMSNESVYVHDLFDTDFNRIRMSQIRFAPSLSQKSYWGFTNQFEAEFERTKLQDNTDRIVAVSKDITKNLFEANNYAGASYTFGYENAQKPYFPDFGMSFFLKGGWKTALQNTDRNFFRFDGGFDFAHRIDKNARFVFANSTDAIWINNNNFEFFQAAHIGGDKNLRSYRRERFSGKSALTNSSDIRWNFGRIKNGLVPANMGIFVGYDIGRVWNDHENSQKWHQSYGGGFWIGLLESVSGKIHYFYGEDGGRISAGIGFGF